MTYSYICTSCGHDWEAEQRISEAPLHVCPKCGESSAKRQIAGPANFILKGGGWYSDLYSSSGGKKSDASKADGAAKAGTADKPAAAEKTETKTETASSSTPSTTPSTPSSSS